MKIVINDGKLNYGLSEAAYEFLGLDWNKLVLYPMERLQPGYKGLLAGMAYQYDRTNPKLIDCVEKLGENAGVPGTFFIIVEIPDGTEYEIVPEILGGEILIVKLSKK